MGRLLQPPDVVKALQTYNKYTELGTKEIQELFGDVSRCTATKLKNQVKDAMIKKGIKSFYPGTVNTKIAYEVWGLDVKDLENRTKELIRLGFMKKEDLLNA